MHRGAWWATVYGVTKESDTTERLKQQFHAHLALSTSFCYITLTLLSSLYICFLPRTCISQEQDSLHTKHNLCSSYMSRNVIDCPMPGHHFEGNPVDEGTTEGLLKLPCIVQKNPQVLHTARQVECHPVNNSIGKRSSIPPHKMRPDSPVPTLQGPCHPS